MTLGSHRLIPLCLMLAACSGGQQTEALPEALSQCAACHSFSKDGARRSGPNLYGIFGRAAGSATDYPYSPALRKSGIVWDGDALDAYLAAPRERIPGTRMTFPGETDPTRRQAMIAYLREQREEDAAP